MHVGAFKEYYTQGGRAGAQYLPHDAAHSIQRPTREPSPEDLLGHIIALEYQSSQKIFKLSICYYSRRISVARIQHQYVYRK